MSISSEKNQIDLSSCVAKLQEDVHFAIEDPLPAQKETSFGSSILTSRFNPAKNAIAEAMSKVARVSKTFAGRAPKKDRRTLNQTEKPFFLPIKFKSTLKNAKQWFIYSYPFIGLYNTISYIGYQAEDPLFTQEEPELEIIDRNAVISIEGKSLIIFTDQYERRFDIKLDRPVIDSLINSSEDYSELLSILKSQVAAGGYPDLNDLTLQFYKSVFYSQYFIEVVSCLKDPPKIYQDNMCHAAILYFEDFVSNQMAKEIGNLSDPIKAFKGTSFAVEFAEYVLSADDKFFEFCRQITLLKSKARLRYAQMFSKIRFKAKSRLFFYYAYHSGLKKFNEDHAALLCVSMLIYRTGFLKQYTGESPEFFESFHSFNRATMTLEKFNAFEHQMINLCKYPVDFAILDFPLQVYESFRTLADFVQSNVEIVKEMITLISPVKETNDKDKAKSKSKSKS